jgi:arabinose-5-phosphate isomerase
MPPIPPPLFDANALKTRALRTLASEQDAIAALSERIDAGFIEAVRQVLEAPGRLIVTGIGKSAHIANKLVATLNSTGTPAGFMHAAEAIHGDLGLVQKGDVILCISKSGNSPEIKALVPLIKGLGHPLIAMTGQRDGFLAQHADLVLDTTVEREACPHNLAPTASTAAQLAMGDALAMCLMEARGFTADDFATYHPGGALGKRLYTTLGDLVDPERRPAVGPEDSLAEVILAMSAGRTGAAVVLEGEAIVGIVTDGDLRRALERGGIEGAKAADVMGRAPRVLASDQLAVEAFQIMEAASITQIIVHEGGRYLGLVHLHDLLREGIF